MVAESWLEIVTALSSGHGWELNPIDGVSNKMRNYLV
jgi:hypothetical protein